MVILYVDDDEEDIEIFCEAVKATDIPVNCLGAHNGKEAMEILDGDLLPDFIFLDVNMPVITGKSLLHKIRQDEKFNAVPVVMCSSSINPMEEEEYKKLGADLFLTKANQFQDLCDALVSILTGGARAGKLQK